jgi:hypothetical protein
MSSAGLFLGKRIEAKKDAAARVTDAITQLAIE